MNYSDFTSDVLSLEDKEVATVAGILILKAMK